MVTFSYRARTVDGALVEGTWTAATEADALEEIREQGQFVIHLVPQRRRAVSALWTKHGDIDAGLICRQLAVLLHSGMPLRESLASLASEGNERETALLVDLRRSVEHGRPFSEALAEHSDVFSPIAVEIVAVGEAAGRLTEMMQQLADWMEQERRTREKLKTMLAYPAILFVETLLIACFLTLVVLPAFASLFVSMDAALPLPTRILLDAATFVEAHGIGLLIAIIVLVFFAIQLSRRPRVRFHLDHWRLSVPVFGRLQREAVWMKSYRALGILLTCTIPLDEALVQAGRVAGNRYIEQRLQSAAHSVRQGFPLSEVLAGEPSLPHILYELLRTGETAGRLPDMLQEGAAYAAIMAEHHAARLQAMAEPAAYLVIFALVGTIVAAVALPWLDMMTLFV